MEVVSRKSAGRTADRESIGCRNETFSLTIKTPVSTQKFKNAYWKAKTWVRGIRQARWFANSGLNLALFDNQFPNPASKFQNDEFCEILKEIKSSFIASKMHDFLGQSLADRIASIEGEYPCFRDRWIEYAGRFPRRGGVYTNFVAQAFSIIKDVESSESRLGFTLYPGGYFSMSSAGVAGWMRRIVDSKSFEWVISTQPVTTSYLKDLGLEVGRNLFEILGHFDIQESEGSRAVHDGSRPLRVVFAAHRYAPGGLDKGFDVFARVASKLRGTDFEFHCIGGFSDIDVPDDCRPESIIFHGWVNSSALPKILSAMDVYVSPNRPGVLWEGAFDGFPLATAVTAGKAGCALVMSDPLNLSFGRFVDGVHYLRVRADVVDVCDRLVFLRRDVDRLEHMRAQGSARCFDLYSPQCQLHPRLRLLERLI